MSRTVLFAHGKESGPWGRKISLLAARAKSLGWHVESPDFSGMDDPAERVQRLVECAPETEILVGVGSSMGGYVMARASDRLPMRGLFLMAPAFFVEDSSYTPPDPRPNASQILIVHGWRDNVVPPENSFRYARQYRVDLRLVDAGHRLTEVLPLLETEFETFLSQVAA